MKITWEIYSTLLYWPRVFVMIVQQHIFRPKPLQIMPRVLSALRKKDMTDVYLPATGHEMTVVELTGQD